VNALQESHNIGLVARMVASTVSLALGLLLARLLVRDWKLRPKAPMDSSAFAFFALCDLACVAFGVGVWLPL